MELHPESKKLFEFDEATEKVKAIALRLLSNRAYTQKEIKEKLQKRDCDSSAIEKTLADLERLNLIDDFKFAQRFVDERLRLKPCGRALLSRDLKRRGVPGHVIDQVLDGALESVDHSAMAYEVLVARARRYVGLEKEKALNRMFGFLGRRGFDGSVSREAAYRVWAEISEEDE